MKRITIIVFLLLAHSAFASEWLSSFSQMRSLVRSALNTSGTTYVSDSTLNEFIREAIVTINPQLRGEREVKSFTTSHSQNTYALDTLTIDIISVEWSYNDTIKSLVYVPRSQWGEQTHKETKDKSGYEKRPSFYDFTDSLIFLYPTPTKTGDTIKVLGVQRLTGMDTLTSLLAMPEAYRVAILKHVIWRLSSSKQHPLTEMYWQDDLSSRNSLSIIFRGVNGAQPAKSQ